MKVTRPSPQPDKAAQAAAKITVRHMLRAVLVAAAGFLVLMVVVILLNPVGLQQGIARLEARWGASLYRYDRTIAEKLSIVIGNYLRETIEGVPDIPTLVIDVPFKEMSKIYAKREAALQQGHLTQGADDFVKGEIRVEGRTVPIKLRLKGDWNDHLAGRKWSFRIHVRNGEQLFGMRRFSIQSPATRGFQSELMYFEVLKKFGVMSPRYSFVNVMLNGEPMGLMALEEFFSKELLEFNRRREGVIVRFDESLVWAATDSLSHESVGWQGAFDYFSNAPIDAIGSGRIAESESLSRQYRVAVGLLRGFVNEELTASEVFDVEQMGRFLAVSDLFGAWHAIAWSNLRFYLNPVTLRLEPIAFDATLQKHMEGGLSVINDEPLLLQIMQDPAVLAVYQEILEELAGLVHSGELVAMLREIEATQLQILQPEFRLLSKFPLDYLEPRIEILQQRFGVGSPTLGNELYLLWEAERRVYPILAHVRLIDEGGYQRLEIANAVPKDVEVLDVYWANAASGERVTVEGIVLPMMVPARGIGSKTQHWFIDPGIAPAPESWHLEVSARLLNRPWIQRIHAITTYAPLTSSPVPESNVAEQLKLHSFLELEEEANRLVVPEGQWLVNVPLIIPPGYNLYIEPGVTLKFAASAVLIVHGSLRVAGRSDSPVVFEAANGDRWPGLIVMGADENLSVIEHLIVKDTSGVALENWVLTGGVNFYASDVEITNTQLEDSHGEDALNIINSRFEISGLTIRGTASDAFDADFSTGSVVDSRFIDIGKAGGGDAIDVSGSQITVSDSEFINISDKALSVGEKSSMTARNLTMQNVGTGAASKDGSSLSLTNVTINGASFAGLTAYIKKPEYGPASIEARDVIISDTETPVLVQTNSVVSIDGEAAETREINVDALYETVMRKGLR